MNQIQFLVGHAQRSAKLQGRVHRIRKVARAQAPIAIELSYAASLEQLLKAQFEAVAAKLDPILPQLMVAAGHRRGARTDSWDQDLHQIMNALALDWSSDAGRKAVIEGVALAVAREISTRQKRELERLLRQALGVDIFVDDPGLVQNLKVFARENTRLIQSLADDYRDDLQTGLVVGIQKGLRVEELRDLIRGRYGVTLAKARFIARDQVGKLNGALNQKRQTSLGVEEYEWGGMDDGRERETHLELNGTIQKWSDPPVTNDNGDRNHPGGDFQCRCTALPVIKI